MRSSSHKLTVVAAGLLLATGFVNFAGAQVVVDGQSTGVVIQAQPSYRYAPVRRTYRSEYNPQTRARIVTKQSAINDSQSGPPVWQLTYDESSTARVITRQSQYDQPSRRAITVRDDSFRVEPYYARRYYEYVPQYSRRNYSYSRYGYWAPYYYGFRVRHSYRIPFHGHGHHGFRGSHGHRTFNRSCFGTSHGRFSSSGFRFVIDF